MSSVVLEGVSPQVLCLMGLRVLWYLCLKCLTCPSRVFSNSSLSLPTVHRLCCFSDKNCLNLSLERMAYCSVPMMFFLRVTKWALERPLVDVSNALLVTAHPDDEVLFFAPTVQALKEQQAHVALLCLSTGAMVMVCLRATWL